MIARTMISGHCTVIGTYAMESKGIRGTLLSYCNANGNYRITLNTPLTPFTVLFCHIIANHKDCKEDLQLLERFIRSMHRSRSVSEGAEKFYQLCSIFWKVAEVYVHVKNTEEQNIQETNGEAQDAQRTDLQPIIGDFDEHLSALGLAPQPFQLGPTDLLSSEFPLEEDMSTYLQDWYSGNASLYGLLEQDLSNISGLGLEDCPAQNL